MLRTPQERRAFERQKILTFNKIKKHLAKYEEIFEVRPSFLEWHYKIVCKIPEARRLPKFEEVGFADIYKEKECVRFFLFPACLKDGFLDDAPSLSQYYRIKCRAFKFYKTTQVDEKELKMILKKAVQVFKDFGYYKE